MIPRVESFDGSTYPNARSLKAPGIFTFLLYVALIALSPGMTSCASFKAALKPNTQVARVENLSLAYTSLKNIIKNNLPISVRAESTNGRTLVSGYFDPDDLDLDATEALERAFTEVTILGSSRPFDVEITAFREKKMKGQTRYSRSGPDKKLALKIADRIKRALADRREDRNVIDDFRAF